ncbi:MAG: hypothetical protein LBL83_09210 [Clostridiales bacterium]|jgi:hypothetical protein|nr:hypothetical protein [Clostridiales bacterium]
MRLQDLFGGASGGWAGYDEYIIVEDSGGRCVTPAAGAKISGYDPLQTPAEIVVEALNVGLICVKPARSQALAERAILGFCAKRGLLGFMCALPATPDFWEHDVVYLPKNPVVKTGSMPLKDYEKIFFPQAKEDMLAGRGKALARFLGGLVPEGEPLIGAGERDTYKTMLKFSDLPFAQRLGFKRGYAEPYEWLRGQFRDWASMFLSAAMYYEETDETMRELHRRAIQAFGGVAPHYRVVLGDGAPSLKWDFHSLLQTIQLLLSVMLSDAGRPLRICPECGRAFCAADPRAAFCSKDCKNRCNVRKSRQNKNGTP